MTVRVSRSRFVAGTASAFASIAIVRSPAKAAQFDYKMAGSTPTNFPVHVRTAQMWDAVKRETNGAIDVKIFPNNQLGSELAQLSQLRSGAIQFMIIQGVSLSSVVPGVSMDGVGFAFKNAAQAEGAYDGPLGAYLRKLILAKGIFAFPRVFNFGMREVTASSHPIRNAADFAGFKIRTPPAPISVDLFKTLGASPTPIVFPELYLALQTKVVDGQETPFSTIDISNFHEVQKYLSVTNHTATIFWFLGNMDAWNALPAAMQSVILKHADTAAVLQRRDTEEQSNAIADKLRREGMTFNSADTDSMRAQLKPFYSRWKTEFGPSAWDLLEKTSGKLT
jgi:tripartite ATP-independent transporter DctP family solute receptor